MAETEHSAYFEKYKRFYDRGLWPIAWLKDAVKKGRITADEFKEITGEDYAE